MFEKEAEEFVPDIKWHDFSSKDLREEMMLCYSKGAEFGFQKGIKAKINTTNISDFPIKKEEAKRIIQDLLNNSDEYARQRAIDFLKEEENDSNS